MADSTIEAIKLQLDLVEEIGAHVPLKRVGRAYRGLCPFHNEKSPSFYVFPETRTWHCFGCHEGGDVFSFFEKTTSQPFSEVLRTLAHKAGVELPERQVAIQESHERQRLRDLLEKAARYYHELLLKAPEAQAARDYVRKRGFRPETVEQFQMGFAKEAWDDLLNYLTARDFVAAEVVQAGLAIERENKSGWYDRFRGRVLFPIRDDAGRIVGFGGRSLDGGQPKYLNSPQTALFDKSGILFGLDQAREPIRKERRAVIVEGYMDAVICHQAGYRNVVACIGSAITERHLQMLKPMVSQVVLALDPDAAGQRAAEHGMEVAVTVFDKKAVPVVGPRGVRLAQELATDIRIARLPDGLDPDELILRDPATWGQIIDAALPFVDYHFAALAEGGTLDSVDGRSAAVQKLLPLIAEVSDPVRRGDYLRRLAALSHVDERELRLALPDSRRKPPARQATAETTPAPVSSRQKSPILAREREILARILANPALIQQIYGIIQSGDFVDSAYRNMYMVLTTHLATAATLDLERLRQELDPALAPYYDEVYATRLTLPPVRDEEHAAADVRDAARRLRKESVRRQVTEAQRLLAGTQDPAEQAEVLAIVMRLSAELKAAHHEAQA